MEEAINRLKELWSGFIEEDMPGTANKIAVIIELLENTQQTDWVPVHDFKFPEELTPETLAKVEVLFECGKTCMYNEEWPHSVTTHMRNVI